MLRLLCPNMVYNYDGYCDYYLTSRDGRGKFSEYNDSEYCQYILIDMSDIDFEGYVLDNGVPLIWEDMV
jgi:hypothetical protein